MSTFHPTRKYNEATQYVHYGWNYYDWASCKCRESMFYWLCSYLGIIPMGMISKMLTSSW